MFSIEGLIRSSEEMTNHCQTTILSVYQKNRVGGHDETHINDVLGEILTIGRDFSLDIDLLQTIALYHDVALNQGRAVHHITFAAFLREDPIARKTFSYYEICLMAEAIEDHRGSAGLGEPRSIYGKAIYDADKTLDSINIWVRYIQAYLSCPRGLSKQELFDWLYGEMVYKYGEQGRIQVWLQSPRRLEKLRVIKEMVRDKDGCYKLMEEILEQETSRSSASV